MLDVNRGVFAESIQRLAEPYEDKRPYLAEPQRVVWPALLLHLGNVAACPGGRVADREGWKVLRCR